MIFRTMNPLYGALLTTTRYNCYLDHSEIVFVGLQINIFQSEK